MRGIVGESGITSPWCRCRKHQRVFEQNALQAGPLVAAQPRSQPDRTPADTPARASPTQDNATERGASHGDQRKIRSVTQRKDASGMLGARVHLPCSSVLPEFAFTCCGPRGRPPVAGRPLLGDGMALHHHNRYRFAQQLPARQHLRSSRRVVWRATRQDASWMTQFGPSLFPSHSCSFIGVRLVPSGFCDAGQGRCRLSINTTPES